MLLSKEQENLEYLQPPKELTRNSPITPNRSPVATSPDSSNVETPLFSSEDTVQSSMNFYLGNDNDNTSNTNLNDQDPQSLTVVSDLNPEATEFISDETPNQVNVLNPEAAEFVGIEYGDEYGYGYGYGFEAAQQAQLQLQLQLQAAQAAQAAQIQQQQQQVQNGYGNNLIANGVTNGDIMIANQLSVIQDQVAQLTQFTYLTKLNEHAQAQHAGQQQMQYPRIQTTDAEEQQKQEKQKGQAKVEETKEEKKEDVVIGYKVRLKNIGKNVSSRYLLQLFGNFCDKENKDSKILDCWIDKKGNGYVIFSDELSVLIALDSRVNLKFGKNQCTMDYEAVKLDNNTLKQVKKVTDHTRQQPQPQQPQLRKPRESRRQHNSNPGTAISRDHINRINQYLAVPSNGKTKKRKLGKLGITKFAVKSEATKATKTNKTNKTNKASEASEQRPRQRPGQRERPKVGEEKENCNEKEKLSNAGWKGISHWKQLRGISVFGKDSIRLFENEIFGKNKNMLILGDVDFSLSSSIVEKLVNIYENNNNNGSNGDNNGQSLIATSHLKSNWRFDTQWGFKRMKTNKNSIDLLSRLGVNSMVLQDVNPLRQSLTQKLKLGDKENVLIDTVIYRLQMADIRSIETMKCLFENINGVLSKSDGNSEIHFVFPIYNTRFPLKRLEILEAGKCKDLSIKWQLKYGKPFVLDRKNTLKKIFPHFVLVSNKGYSLDYQSSNYMAYCIMEQVSENKEFKQEMKQEMSMVAPESIYIYQSSDDDDSENSENCKSDNDETGKRKKLSHCSLI